MSRYCLGRHLLEKTRGGDSVAKKDERKKELEITRSHFSDKNLRFSRLICDFVTFEKPSLY